MPRVISFDPPGTLPAPAPESVVVLHVEDHWVVEDFFGNLHTLMIEQAALGVAHITNVAGRIASKFEAAQS